VHALVDVLLVVAGVAATVVVLDAAVRTFVVPRGTVVLFTVVVFRVIKRGFDLFASPRRTYEARDRVMAFYAPIGLLALPLVSMLVVFGAFACIFAGIEELGWRSAIMTSGSSLLTLGFQRPPDLPAAFAASIVARVYAGLVPVISSVNVPLSAVGVVLNAKLGDRVARGQPIAVLHANDEGRLIAAERVLRSAFAFSRMTVEPPPVILERLATTSSASGAPVA